MAELNIFQKTFIGTFADKLTAFKISEMIEVNVDIVKTYVGEYCTKNNLVPFLPKVKKPKHKILQKNIPVKTTFASDVPKKEQKVYADVKRDLSKMITLRIDKKTTIYIRKDENPEEARKKFLDRQIKPEDPDVLERRRAKERKLKHAEEHKIKVKKKYPDYYGQ